MTALEKVYVVFALLTMARGVIPIIAAQGDQGQASQFDAVSFVLQIGVFAILAGLIYVRWNSFAAGCRASLWVLAVCVLAIASAGWSSEPSFTFRRALILLATTVFGIYIASRVNLDEQLSLFGWLTVVSVIGSFLMGILFPEFGISQDVHAGAWKGLFPHKNALGQQMLFGILVLAIGKPKGISRGIRSASLLGAIVLLLLSRSATAISVLAAIAVIYATLHLIRVKRRSTLPLWLIFTPLVVACVAITAVNGGLFLEILGRNSTLTGRTAIWSAVAKAIADRFWFGYGFAVFWRWGLHGTAANVFRAIHWSGLRQAQSGYLDLCLDLGIVGLFVFLCGFGLAVWRGLKLFRDQWSQGTKWPLMFLIFLFIYNFVEGSLIQLYTFLWVPYVSVFASLAFLRIRAREDCTSELQEDGSAQIALVVTSS